MKAFAVIFVLLFFGFIQVFASSDSFALEESLWTDGMPTIVKNKNFNGDVADLCSTYRQYVFVTELGAPRNMCVYGDERLKIGTFTEQGVHGVAVEFAHSTTMHVLNGVCGGQCYYSADTDVLVTQQQISQYGTGLVIFRHVSSRISRVVESASSVRYVFDTSNPDYEMKNDSGRYIWTPSYSLSANGKWVVAELYDSGLAIVDIDTMTSRQITTEGYAYGRGMDPTEELAISNDGKSVALGGQNVGLHMYDVIDSCGQELIGSLTLLPTTTRCPTSDLGIGVTFPNFFTARHPRFIGTGHEFEVIVNSWGSGPKRVTYVTKGTPVAHRLKLLSLGDSFSSGEGEVDDGFYELGTNQGFDMCHVSMRAYSALIAASMIMSGAEAKNVACSGAKISDIFGSDDYLGQGGRLGSAGLQLSTSDRAVARDAAIESFQPGRALQSDFINRYNPEILTIGAGGNDAGLMGKLRTCAMPGTCEWAEGGGIEETAGEIRRLFDTLGSLFAVVARQAEDSRVFVIGYPNIIDPDGVCDLATNFLLDHTERVFIQRSIHYLNQVIHAASIKAGFAYVDIEHSFDGTKLCDGNTSTSMNGVRIGDDIAVIQSFPMLKVIGAETFHPTPNGHKLIADTILSEYPEMEATSPDTEEIDIDPLQYSNAGGAVDSRSAFVGDFAFLDHIDATRMTIEVPDGTLQPNSTATIEVHSVPSQLATFVVNEQGGIRGEITLPTTLEEGFHTLHLYSVNRAGDAIDMYQFLTTGKSGVMLGTSVGEGTGSASVVSGYDSSSPSSDGVLSDVASVLGAQSANGIDGTVRNTVLPIVSSLGHRLWTIRWLLLGGAILFMIVVSTVCSILILKKWVKPGS